VTEAEEFALRARLKDDFAFYAEEALKIRPKQADAGLVPLRLNTAQRYLHAKAEDQLKRTGKVRLIIPKGRQQGCSTYIGGRFYWKTTHQRGIRTYILTHEMEATENLFGMTERFNANCPPAIRPKSSADNAKELVFGGLDSSYGIGTAGARATGRSQTIQLFHGSEAAYWQNPEDHISGVGQAVPDLPGTEMWIESTANGPGNWFHKECMKALKGNSVYELAFIPWFWQEEYRAPLPPDFKVSPEEDELIDLFGLDGQQLMWRRNKLASGMNPEKFKQEYPCTIEEAFESAGEDVIIGSRLVRAAIGREVTQVEAPVVWGVDPARFGDDRKTLAKRCGNVMLEPVKVLLKDMPAGPQSDTQALAGAVIKEFRNTVSGWQPHYICVDTIGVGAGVADALRAAGLRRANGAEVVIIDVNVSEAPSSDDKFMHLRDELWWAVREWFHDRACRMSNDDDFVTEVAAVTYNYTAASRVKVEGKKEMKKRLGFSPDKADAFMITFAAPKDMPVSSLRPGPTGRVRGDRKAGY
jgi:hypothetical protein